MSKPIVRALSVALAVLGILSVPAQLATAAGSLAPFFIYLPLVQRGCAGTGETYGTSLTSGPTTDRPADIHADLNMWLRGSVNNNNSGLHGLVTYGGQTAADAPQLSGLLGRVPTFTSSYKIYDWNWAVQPNGAPGALLTEYPVTYVGMQTTSGEAVRLPDRGGASNIDPVGHKARVLYAEAQRITLKYTSEDNVVFGYTLHVDNICVDAALLAAYQQWNAAGRSNLPALSPGQAFGTAQGTEIRVAIRDVGTFLDPRSCRDWWKSVCPN